MIPRLPFVNRLQCEKPLQLAACCREQVQRVLQAADAAYGGVKMETWLRDEKGEGFGSQCGLHVFVSCPVDPFVMEICTPPPFVLLFAKTT